MNPSPADADRPLLEVRRTRASSVIVHHVPADCVERFLEWQRGITRAAEAFTGYQATDAYPPAPSSPMEWVVVIHFDNSEALQRWLDSPERGEWTAKLPAEIADFRLKTLSAGFGPWFAGLVADDGSPPHWKLWLAVLLWLYPIVMLIAIFVSPHTNKLFGVALAMLIGNAVSVAIIEWGTPVYKFILGWWFRASGKEGRARSLIGLILILGALGLMTFLFSLTTG